MGSETGVKSSSKRSSFPRVCANSSMVEVPKFSRAKQCLVRCRGRRGFSEAATLTTPPSAATTSYEKSVGLVVGMTAMGDLTCSRRTELSYEEAEPLFSCYSLGREILGLEDESRSLEVQI
jgi:hypothetical protein